MYKHVKHVPECVRALVAGDFQDVAYYEEPTEMKLEDAVGYWDEFIEILKEQASFIPRSLTPEIYVQLWNEEVELYKTKCAQ